LEVTLLHFSHLRYWEFLAAHCEFELLTVTFVSHGHLLVMVVIQYLGEFSIKELLFSLGFDSDDIPDCRIDVDGCDGSQGGPCPVDDPVLDVGVTLAPELEAGGKNRIEIASGG